MGMPLGVPSPPPPLKVTPRLKVTPPLEKPKATMPWKKVTMPRAPQKP